MAKTYDYCEIKLEEYEWENELCVLQVGCEYSTEDFYEGNGFDPPEGGEVELGAVRVVSALIGCDLIEANADQLQSIRKQLLRDKQELGSLEERVGKLVCD